MLEIKSLKKSYQDFSLSLDLHVDVGETLALVGPSGSGKTTALNLIAGLAEPESGRIIIDGEDLTDLPAWKRNISVVFQDLALFPHLDVGGNIAYGLYIRGVKRKERRRIIEETLNIVHLPGYASRRIDTLSGGERQRVAIARSLASSPRLLLLDEPFSSLDAPLRKSLRREFLEIRNSPYQSHSKVPCIFVTHDQEEAIMLGDRIALMSNGRIVETAPGRDILLAPKTETAARFFDAGQVLPCTILGNHEGGVEVSSPLGTFVVQPDLENNSSEYTCTPKLFLPEDAIRCEVPVSAGWKPCKVRLGGSLFEGKSLILQVIPFPWEEETVPTLEINAGKRMKPPVPGSDITLWVDQSLLRFVKQESVRTRVLALRP
jgi:ABC-type Fe3+/spermidine/putrescine transport system ATPase subunit